MALPSRFTGIVGTHSRGVIDAIEKQLKFINLKPVKSISFSFNPFQEDVNSVRRAAFFLYRDKVRETNLKCVFKTSVHNFSEKPLLTVKLVSGETILFKTSNLTALEICQKFNELISSKVKEEEE